MPDKTNFPWIGQYQAAPPRPLPTLGDTSHRLYTLDLIEDGTFTLTEAADLKFSSIRGRWILSTPQETPALTAAEETPATFDYITLVPQSEGGLASFGPVFFPITFSVGEFGIRDASHISTDAGWVRSGAQT